MHKMTEADAQIEYSAKSLELETNNITALLTEIQNGWLQLDSMKNIHVAFAKSVSVITRDTH